MNGKDINRKAAESLIKCGAFDCFDLNRRQMIENYDRIFSSLQDSARQNIEGQINFFDTGLSAKAEVKDAIPFVPEYDIGTLLEFEKEATGMYVSGHPLDKYNAVSKAAGHISISSLFSENKMADGTAVKLISVLRDVKLHKTKNGSAMAFAAVEDKSGECEAIFFPEAYSLSVNLIRQGSAVFIEGKLSCKDEAPKIIAGVVMSPEQYVSSLNGKKLFVRLRSSDSEAIQNILRLCSENDGSSEITFYFEDIKKYVKPKDISGVQISEQFLTRLSEIVGIDNVLLGK